MFEIPDINKKHELIIVKDVQIFGFLIVSHIFWFNIPMDYEMFMYVF